MTVTTQALPSGDAGRVEEVPDPQLPERAKRRSYTAKYKAEILAEYDRLDRDGKGALLRREGLYNSLCCIRSGSPTLRRPPCTRRCSTRVSTWPASRRCIGCCVSVARPETGAGRPLTRRR